MSKELEQLGHLATLNQSTLVTSENSDSDTLSQEDKLCRPDEHFRSLLNNTELLPKKAAAGDKRMTESRSLSALDQEILGPSREISKPPSAVTKSEEDKESSDEEDENAK